MGMRMQREAGGKRREMRLKKERRVRRKVRRRARFPIRSHSRASMKREYIYGRWRKTVNTST